ncbi:MAG: putative baseplate assembly protein [Verrucomicrobiia bacterium]
MSEPDTRHAAPFPQLYFCCDERRHDAVRGSALNGIDYLEVVDHDAPTVADRQRLLRLHFINPITLNSLAASNVRISGGERIRPIMILGATIGAGDDADVLTVEVEQPGDFSIYTLVLVRGPHDALPPDGIDPRLAAIEFSFKVECPSDFDCAPGMICSPPPALPPEINYLAKDYASFRELILDRMALLLPDWRERNPADLGITLVELLAYLGDQLSYQQDAVATEAYLSSARNRTSLQRHARLVDYFVQHGLSARVWVHLTTGADDVSVPAGTQILGRLDRVPPRLEPGSNALDDALRQRPAVFETAHEITLFVAHNEMAFYTWGDRECCLPKGATRATLAGHFPGLRAGAVLIFEEARAVLSGRKEDADRTHRCALRLTDVRAFAGLNQPLTDLLSGAEVTEIEWMPEDALPFPFCLSGFTDAEQGAQFHNDLAVVRGNIALADHGRTITSEPIGEVPDPVIRLPADPGADRCHRPPPRFARPRFRPALKTSPLTQSSPYDATLPASASLRGDPDAALPAIELNSVSGTDADVWRPRRDLLGSAPDATEFVVEVENDGRAYLRFGDDEYGQEPEPRTRFEATYRTGSGAAGNVGADALAHIVSSDPALTMARNPMPATGGADPVGMEEIRRDAPQAFRTQQRAVTEADYARTAELDRSIQRAAATFRWTGSWHTVFVTADRFDGLAPTPEFKAGVGRTLEPLRMAGHDLEVDSPRHVPLQIAVFVCVKPGYFRGDVEAALLQVFSSHTLPTGRKGLFHPDHYTFGQTVYLSPFYAAAQEVPGVASARITIFQRQDRPETSGLASGYLTMNRLEIARLENDPNFPERGTFRLQLGGGR